jgi:hypothetical protein
MFNDSITRLKKDLFEFCEGLGISTEDLAIFQNAAEIKLVFMEFLKIEDDVTFDFDDELYGIIDSLKVEDFDDPHTGVDLLKEIEIA